MSRKSIAKQRIGDKELKKEMDDKNHVREGWVITVDKITKQCRKMSNCKAPGKTKYRDSR